MPPSPTKTSHTYNQISSSYMPIYFWDRLLVPDKVSPVVYQQLILQDYVSYFLYTQYYAFLMLLVKIVAIVLSLYSMSFLFFGGTTFAVHAQSDLQTIKYRNLVIDLANGVKTNAQITYPAVAGSGKYPGVLLITGSGAE